MADDQWVTLEGKLVKHLGGENYMFRDDSGEVEVEVDGDVWRGTEVGPDDLIRVRGEVDHSWNKTEVEVEHLEKVGRLPRARAALSPSEGQTGQQKGALSAPSLDVVSQPDWRRFA